MPPHGVAGGAGVAFDVVEVERDRLGSAAWDAEGAGGVGAVSGVINHGVVGPAGGEAGVLADVTDLDPESDVVMAVVEAGADDAVAGVEEPGRAVADGEGISGGGGLTGGDGAAAVAAVKVGVLGAGIEGEVEVVLDDLVGADTGGVEGGLPVLVVGAGAAIEVPG